MEEEMREGRRGTSSSSAPTSSSSSSHPEELQYHHSRRKMWRRRIQMPMVMIIFTLVITIHLFGRAHALDCIQCDRQALWYSPEENERHIARCQRGLIPATRCANASHTHCIYNYYKQGGVITVTERRCGRADEASGCTLYKSLVARARRHLIGGARLDAWREREQSPATSNRRRETGPLVVEVCAGGCTRDGCTSGGATRAATPATVTVLATLAASVAAFTVCRTRVIGVG